MRADLTIPKGGRGLPVAERRHRHEREPHSALAELVKLLARIAVDEFCREQLEAERQEEARSNAR